MGKIVLGGLETFGDEDLLGDLTSWGLIEILRLRKKRLGEGFEDKLELLVNFESDCLGGFIGMAV